MSRMDAASPRGSPPEVPAVVLVTRRAPAPNPAQRTETTDRKADDAGYVRLEHSCGKFQARHPTQLTLVDLAGEACLRGPPVSRVRREPSRGRTAGTSRHRRHVGGRGGSCRSCSRNRTMNLPSRS